MAKVIPTSPDVPAPFESFSRSRPRPTQRTGLTWPLASPAMADAWIGVVGAAIGALAGIVGGWTTYFLTSRRARRNEIREAAADLIAKASLPTVVNSALEVQAIKRKRLAELIIPWSEDTMRARAKLAALAPDVFQICDYLWQRSSDQMNAVMMGDTDTAGSLAGEVASITIELEQALAHETSRRRIGRALD